MRVIFILPVLTQARFQKRIDALLDVGTLSISDIEVLSFQRSYIPNTFKYPYTSLGNLSHGSYLSRILILIPSLFKINKIIRKNDTVYCFGLDMALIAVIMKLLFFKKIRIVYEIADIRQICLKKSILGRSIRKIEKFVLKRAYLLVVTSEEYINGYYKNILKMKKLEYLVIENKIFGKISNSDFHNKQNDAIKIGYFGLLRDQTSWDLLKDISKIDGYEVVVYGFPFGIINFEEDIKTTDINYKGTYDGYDEMARIYNEVDIVWAVYPFSKEKVGNWKWARTNRFYESCYFRKPLIVSSETQDAKYVQKYNIGLLVDLSGKLETVNRVKKINRDMLKLWIKNFNIIPKETYLYTDEHNILLDKILLNETNSTVI